MILIGEGKVHADNLPDAVYYTNNRDSICKTLYLQMQMWCLLLV